MPHALDLPAAPTSPARILFVDDDAFMRRALSTTLSNRGYTTRLADSAGAAMEILRTERVDIVLTDQQMPGQSGLDLMRMMRDEGFETPVILVTGFGSVEMAVTAVRAGAVHFLTKPVDPHELQQLITDILETPLQPRKLDAESARSAATTPISATPIPGTPMPGTPMQATTMPAIAMPATPTAEPPAPFTGALPPGTEVLVLASLDVAEAERLLILRALERTANNRTAAAALLGMHPRTLRRKMRAMQIAPGKAARIDD